MKRLKKGKHEEALLLNTDGSPIGTISWQRALVLTNFYKTGDKNGLIPIDYYPGDYVEDTKGAKFPVPAVVMSPVYIKRKEGSGPAFSKKNVFLRDKCTCQYCGFYDPTLRSLTFDHVVPRSVWTANPKYIGTPTTWTNIVTCCEPCNKKKADKSPKDVGMSLRREPKKPSSHQFILGVSPWRKIPKQWEPYMTPLYKYHLDRKNS